MSMFKTILLSFLLLSMAASADTSFLGKSAEQALLVDIQPDSKTFVSGKIAKLHGTIKVVKGSSDWSDWLEKIFGDGDKNNGLLEMFNKQGVQIVGTFPNATVDVTSQVVFKSKGKGEIDFTFESAVLNAADANQFSVRVYNNQEDKERLKRLSSIIGKLERRLAALQDLKKDFENRKSLAKVVAIVEEQIAKLSDLRDQVLAKIDSDDNLIAENTKAIQVDNKTASSSRVATSIDGFRFSLQADVGVAFEGTPINLLGTISKIGKRDDNDDFYKDFGKSGYLAELYKDGKLLQSITLPEDGSQISLSGQISSFSKNDGNVILLTLYRAKNGKKHDKIGSLTQSIDVNIDNVPPQWLATSLPAQGTSYVKTLSQVFLTAFDPFGRLNLQSFDASFSGTTLSGGAVSQDITGRLTSYKNLDGAQYTWAGSIIDGQIEDGAYTFTAAVSDTSGNKAPLYVSKIVVDNVPPVISFGVADKTVFAAANSTVHVNVKDVSPVQSYIYLNSQKIVESQSTSINVALNLNPGTNTLRVQSTDAAGNPSSASINIILDIPPVASFIATTNLMSAHFDATSSQAYFGSIGSYIWSFGDGVTGFGASADHTYAIPGDYSVQLTVTDSYGLQSTTVKTVTAIDPPPVLSYTGLTTFYSNKLPAFVPVSVTVDKTSQVTVNQVAMNNGGGSYSGNVSIPAAGSAVLNFVATDAYGTKGYLSQTVNLTYQNIPPVISTDLKDHLLTNRSLVSFNVTVQDSIPTTTHIIVGGIELMQTGSKQFAYQAYLPVQGDNLIQIVSVDAAGNTTTISRTVTKDTVPPTLLSVTPADGSTTQQLAFNVSGTASKALASISIGSTNLTLSSDGKSFSGVYVAAGLGAQQMIFTFQDLAGNQGTLTQSVTVNSVLLVPSLLSVVPSGDGQHLWVVGAPSATSPGASVTVAASLFGNGASVTSNSVGGFGVQLSNFTSAKVTVKDTQTGETATTTVQFGGSTTLAGMVEDTSGTPLVNVKIGFGSSSAVAYTDATGHFAITNPPTGDQTIYVDASGVSQNPDIPNRSYAVTHIALSIGVGQSNVLENPIFLTPLMLDGSETMVSSNAEATVTSSYAPGVQLTIPAGVTTFPGGATSSPMNMMTVSSSRTTTTVPLGFVPTNVISLEPSGTKFSQPVQLSVPNDNQLPSGTPMVFISMNSAKGKWELDGLGQVSSDGNSVVTNPDSGITHFSAVYAVPLAPLIASIENPNLIGIDASEGGLTNSIKMPSFKVFGQDYSPSMTYKSGWANPTAVVSDIFTIPKPMPPQSGTGSGSNSTTGWQKVVHCWDVMWGWEECRSAWISYLIYDSYQADWQGQNLWVPDSVNSQFFVGTLASDQVSFSNTAIDDKVKQINGTNISNAAATQILTQTGIPTSAVVSYGVKLVDPATGQYMASGIHPALARFQIKLKNLTITTTTTTQTRYIWVDDSLVETLTQTMVNTGIDTQIVNLLPQDIQSDILVQNKTQSPAGRGWNINGAARIYNPTNSRVMLEEADGTVGTYAVNNTISTLFDSAGTQVDLTHGVDLSVWPTALTGNYDPSSKSSYFAQMDLSSSSPSVSNINSIPTHMGHFASQNFASCTPQTICDNYGCNIVYNGTFYPSLYSYTMKYKLGGLVRASNGEIFATSNREHSFVRNGGSTVYGLVFNLATDRRWSTDDGGAQLLLDLPANQMNPYCDQQAGFDCGPEAKTSTGYDCRNYDTPPFPFPAVNGDGTMGASAWPFSSSYGPFAGFNSPSFVIGLPSGNILFSDTGNSRVVTFNPANSQFSLFAGNSQTYDNGDGSSAINASIFHPTGVAYDQQGNIYVASEHGYIRKISSSGVISTIVGGGTVMSDQADARSIMLKTPQGLAYDSVNNYLYVADTGNNRVMQINLTTGIANKVAGNNQCATANIGDGGAALLSSICSPTVLGLDDQKNLVVVDSGHGKIRRVQFSSATSGPLAFAPTSNDGSRLFKNANGIWTRQFRSGDYEYFDQSGYQTQRVDRVGRTVSFSYDSDHNLNQIQFPSGQSLTYNFSGGLLGTITDPAGRTTKFSYSGNTLSSVQFPDGTSRVFQYDTDGQMLADTDARGNSMTFSYNEWNRLAKVTQPDGSSQVFNDLKSQTIANNYTAGATAPMVNPGLGDGQAATQYTNANSSTTSLTSDHMGLINQIKDAQGNVTKITRDLLGRTIKIEKPDGTSKFMAYDSNTGDLLSTTDNATGAVNSKSYNLYGQVLSETNGNGKITSYVYGSTGLLTSVTDPSGSTVSYTYNSQGLPLQKVVQNGSVSITSSYSYDSYGNINKMTGNDGNSTSFTYDLAGNQLTATSTSTGSDVLTTVNTYDLFNRVLSVKSPKNEVTSYSYLPTGELHFVTDPKNQVTTFQFDNNHHMISKTDPMGNFYTFAYDKMGNRVQETDPNGNVKNFVYDSLNHLVTVTMPDDSIVYKYNVRGEVLSATNSVSQVSTLTDTQGHTTFSQVAGVGAMANYPSIGFNYAFDLDGNRTQLSTSNGYSVSYGYDQDDRLTGMATPSGNFAFGYDGAGRLTGIARPGGSSIFAYTSGGALSSIQHNESNGSDFENLTYNKRYLPTIKRTPAGEYDITYDGDGQILTASNPNTGVAAEGYSYDSMGNRVTDSLGGSSSYDAASQRLTDDGNFSYMYDNNGNTLRKISHDATKESFAFTYNSKNQLIQTQVFIGNVLGSVKRQMNYQYDVLGRRMQKVVTDNTALSDITKSYTRNYVYDGQNIFFETDGAGTILAQHTHTPIVMDDILASNITSAGVSAGLAQSSKNYYYLKDHLGSVTSIADSSGNIVQRYDYRTFGKILSIRNSSGVDISSAPIVNTAFNFTGREWDREAGLFYFRARYYDPSIGRFLQQDPEPGSLKSPLSVINKYAYCGNLPTAQIDPSGRASFWSWLSLALLPALVLTAIQIPSLAKSFGFNPSEVKTIDISIIAVAAAIYAPAVFFSAFGGTVMDAANTGDWSGNSLENSFLNNLAWSAVTSIGLNYASDGNAFGEFGLPNWTKANTGGSFLRGMVFPGLMQVYSTNSDFRRSIQNAFWDWVKTISIPRRDPAAAQY